MLNVLTDEKGIRIYKQIKNTKDGREFATYCVQISNKTTSGEWKQGYVTVRFKTGVTVPNKSIIKINNSFFTFNPNVANGEKYPYIFIMDFEILEEGDDGMNAGNFNVSSALDDEMPFL